MWMPRARYCRLLLTPSVSPRLSNQRLHAQRQARHSLPRTPRPSWPGNASLTGGHRRSTDAVNWCAGIPLASVPDRRKLRAAVLLELELDTLDVTL